MLLDLICHARPNHHLIIGDFDELPDVQVPGKNAPLVASKVWLLPRTLRLTLCTLCCCLHCPLAALMLYLRVSPKACAAASPNYNSAVCCKLRGKRQKWRIMAESHRH